MNQDDHGLVAELDQLNGQLAVLAVRIMDGSAGPTTQQDLALRLLAVGMRLQERARRIGGDAGTSEPLALPGHTVERGNGQRTTPDERPFLGPWRV